MVPPSVSDRVRNVGRSSGPTRSNETSSSNGGVRVSDTAPQVKLASMPYSFSQQMPAMAHKKAPTPDDSKPNKVTWGAKSPLPRTISSTETVAGVWGPKKPSHPNKKPITAAEIVAYKPQEKSADVTQQNGTGSLQEFELYSRLVPKTSVVPKIPGRTMKSSRGLRGSSRVKQNILPTAHMSVSPVKPVSKSTQSTKLQSLSSSSASIERKRKALGEAAAANGASSLTKNLQSGHDEDSVHRSDVDEDAKVSIAELEAVVADRGRREPYVGRKSESREPPPADQIPLPAKLKKRTVSHYNVSSGEGEKKQLPRSASLSQQTFRSTRSRATTPRMEQSTTNPRTPTSFSKVVESRMGAGQNPRTKLMRANSSSKIPSPGLGRAPAGAFFPNTQARKPPNSRVGSHANGAMSKARERPSLPPPIPKNARADALKRAFKIVPKAGSASDQDRRSGSKGHGSRTQDGNYKQEGGESHMEVNGERKQFTRGGYESGPQFLDHETRQRTMPRRSEESNFKDSDGEDILEHVTQAYRSIDDDEDQEKEKKVGVIGTPPAAFTRGGDGITSLTRSETTFPPASGYHALWSDPKYHRSAALRTSGALSSPVVRSGGANGVSSVAESSDGTRFLSGSNESEFDCILRQWGVKPQDEESGNALDDQCAPRRKYYSHF